MSGNIKFWYRRSVDQNRPVLNGNSIPRDANHSLYEVPFRVYRIVEDYNLSPLGRVDRKAFPVIIDPPERENPGKTFLVDLEIDHLVYQQELPVLQGWVHAGPIDLEVLDAGLNDKKHDQGQQDSF